MAETKCHVCGKTIDTFASTVLGDVNYCRICKRPACAGCREDGVCRICREKLKERVQKKSGFF